MGNKINILGSAFAMLGKSVSTAVFSYLVLAYLVGLTPLASLAIVILISLAEIGVLAYLTWRKKIEVPKIKLT
jgi:hypothetical protein